MSRKKRILIFERNRRRCFHNNGNGARRGKKKNFKVRKGKEAMCPKTIGRGKKRLLREKAGARQRRVEFERWNKKGWSKLFFLLLNYVPSVDS